MSDEPFYSPNRQPRPGRIPKPGEPLWEYRNSQGTWSGELRFHGESYGWEATTLRDGELVMSRRFLLREHAIRWAEAKRQEVEKG